MPIKERFWRAVAVLATSVMTYAVAQYARKGKGPFAGDWWCPKCSHTWTVFNPEGLDHDPKEIELECPECNFQGARHV
jgi:hypothetical protein